MRIGVPREIHEGEKRVATTPEVAELLIKLGFKITIESDAGFAAKFTDDTYREVGVAVVKDVKALYHDSDIILKVRPPEIHPELSMDELELFRDIELCPYSVSIPERLKIAHQTLHLSRK